MGISIAIISNLFQASYLTLHHLCGVPPIKDCLMELKHLYFYLFLLNKLKLKKLSLSNLSELKKTMLPTWGSNS